MVMCVYSQHHGPAAMKLGIRAELRKNFTEALEYYQAGTKFGSKESAIALRMMFDLKQWSLQNKEDQVTLKELAIFPDADREIRYDQISQALDLNPDLNLTRLDQVLPLPPAVLPAWHGVQDAIEPEPDGPPTY